MEFHGLYPRQGGREDKIPVSRDYKLVINCENISCPINRLNFCSMPSAIFINSGGKCKTGADLIEENARAQPPKIGYYKHEGD